MQAYNKSMSKSPVIKLNSVSKKFGSTKAVDDVSLEVDRGEVVGFVGVNGAGKTTTIAMLLGFIRATSGDIQIFGRPMNVTAAHKFHHQIGYAAGDMEMFDKLTGKQYLEFILRANGIKNRDRYNELVNQFQPQLDKKIISLSRGNRQKVALIAAFMTSPKLVILDEPSSGLDPLMQQVFLDLVRHEQSKGTTIFMSSHVLSEVADVCSRVVLIARGRIIKDFDTTALDQISGKCVRVVSAKMLRPPQKAENITQQKTKDAYELEFVYRGDLLHLQTWLVRATDLLDLSIVDHDIESMVDELYHKEDER